MGVYSGLIMLGVALWYHQTAIQVNLSRAEGDKENGWKWFWIGAAAYMGGQIVGLLLNWLVIGGEIDVGIGASFGEASGGDTGLQGIVFEFIPILFALLSAFFVRRQWLLNNKIKWISKIFD